MNNDEIHILKRALIREKAARKQAEKILENKSRELFGLTQELKDANEKLEDLVIEKKSELQGVFDNLVDAYVLMDLHGNVFSLNNAAKELFGYDINLEKLNVLKLIYKEDYKYAMTSFRQLITKGSFSDYIARVNTKNKGVRWVHINASLIYNKKKKPIGAQGIVKDITEQMKIEEQNKSLLIDLENNNLELKEYAHIVSHDLKSPLRSIYALVSWIKEDYGTLLDSTGVYHISLIEKTLEKMENLINDVLEYSKASNADSLKNEEIDLNITIKQIINTIFIPPHISVSIKKTLPIIRGDNTRIQQLFQNLISNGVTYNDKEVGLIEIDFENHDSFYVFSIKDNGIGIQKEYHNKIFKIFQSLGDNKDSTGIGLSIVKKIVDLYEGDIWVESEPSVGTTFHFSFKK